jgi:V/A-type H+-transporting ATPase subunit D
MPLKRTKSELKVQREALKRYQRYLPTLQLKKQQLQAEVRHVETARAELEAEHDKVKRELQSWVGLFAEDLPLGEWLILRRIDTGTQHIAGVDVPVLRSLEIDEVVPNRLDQPVWIDDGLRALRREIEFRMKLHVLDIQQTLLEQELRTTSQRVNLFEKIKIPECRNNIRIIRITLGDEQVAGVARGKLAKRKSEESAA